MRERFENDVDKLEVDHLVIGDGCGRLGVGHRARRVDEQHHVAHAVIEMQVRAEAADERVEDAGFHHRWAQVDRAAGLRIAVREVEARDPVLDCNGDCKLDRLVERDPIAVEQTFRGRFSFRQLGDGRAQFIRCALEDGGEGVGDGGRAETGAQFSDSCRAHLGHSDLGVDVAAQPGPAVGCWRG